MSELDEESPENRVKNAERKIISKGYTLLTREQYGVHPNVHTSLDVQAQVVFEGRRPPSK